MKILRNFCHPKDDHLENEARNQTYKPIGQFIHESRTKNRNISDEDHGRRKFEYQGWNHPYSASGYYMREQQRNAPNRFEYNRNPNRLYDTSGVQDASYSNGQSKKISFKDFSQALCGVKGAEVSDQQQHNGMNRFHGAYGYDEQEVNLQNCPNPHYGNRYDMNEPLYSRNYFSRYEQQQQEIEERRRNQGREVYESRNRNQISRQIPYFSQMHNENQQNSSYIGGLQDLNNTLVSRENTKLKDENKHLKRLIEEEYKPLKELYTKLITEQEERDYLISKLEWKVNELKKEATQASSTTSPAYTPHKSELPPHPQQSYRMEQQPQNQQQTSFPTLNQSYNQQTALMTPVTQRQSSLTQGHSKIEGPIPFQSQPQAPMVQHQGQNLHYQQNTMASHPQYQPLYRDSSRGGSFPMTTPRRF